jgi:hypothetical protein
MAPRPVASAADGRSSDQPRQNRALAASSCRSTAAGRAPAASGPCLGFGRIVASDIEPPNILVNLV